MGCPFSALWQTVTGKNIKAPHPVAENNTEEPASPSRRSLLMGLGAASGALALGGLASKTALAAPQPAAILPDDAKFQCTTGGAQAHQQ
jgi:ferric-dicitrate binding protein FerR (iron transport regulator)